MAKKKTPAPQLHGNSKLTPDLQDRICGYLSAGVPIRWAAEAAGIHYTTFYDWKARGDEWVDSDDTPPAEVQPYVTFAYATRRALAEGRAGAALELMSLIRSANVDHAVKLRAIQFFLTHGDRDNWHPVQHAGELTEDVEIELAWD